MATALACAVAVAITGCGTTGAQTTMTIDEAQKQAKAELRSVLELAPDTWPQDVPVPVANDCQVDGERAVQFSYYVEVEDPAEPRSLVERAGDRWEQEGYRLSKSQTEMDAATGTAYAIVARADDKPRASMAATKVRAHVSIDSVCVIGDPDDYR